LKEFQMNWFSRFVATIDTPGGHVIVCLTLIALGASLTWFRVPKGEDLFVAATAAVFLSMRGRGSENHDSRQADERTNLEAPPPEKCAPSV
jgi:hypothetical protein